MDELIKALATKADAALLVAVLAYVGLMWLCRYLLSALREQAAAWTAEQKANAEADLKLAEALTALKTVVERCTSIRR